MVKRRKPSPGIIGCTENYQAELQITPIVEGAIECVQPRDGYHFSVDALLLASFVLNNSRSTAGFVELGSGCGVISALLARGGFERGLAIEQDALLACCTRQTFERNGLTNRIQACRGDIRSLHGLVRPGEFNVVVANPPFHPAGSGHLPPNSTEANARHELTCTMNDVLSAARYILRPGGTLYLIYPVHRLPELLILLPVVKFSPAIITMVHPKPGANASHFLLKALKASTCRLSVTTPLVIAGEKDSPAPWYIRLCQKIEAG